LRLDPREDRVLDRLALSAVVLCALPGERLAGREIRPGLADIAEPGLDRATLRQAGLDADVALLGIEAYGFSPLVSTPEPSRDCMRVAALVSPPCTASKIFCWPGERLVVVVTVSSGFHAC
jgi:hypothetical protein